jgi:hypothetical protein
MRVTIICEDKDVEAVRAISASFITSHTTMSKPLSPNGKLPQTHWLCVCDMSVENIKRLKSEAKYSKILTGNPKLILKELNLIRIN